MKKLVRKLIIWAFRQEFLILDDGIYRISNIEGILMNNPTLKDVDFEAARFSLFNERELH